MTPWYVNNNKTGARFDKMPTTTSNVTTTAGTPTISNGPAGLVFGQRIQLTVIGVTETYRIVAVIGGGTYHVERNVATSTSTAVLWHGDVAIYDGKDDDANAFTSINRALASAAACLAQTGVVHSCPQAPPGAVTSAYPQLGFVSPQTLLRFPTRVRATCSHSASVGSRPSSHSQNLRAWPHVTQLTGWSPRSSLPQLHRSVPVPAGVQASLSAHCL